MSLAIQQLVTAIGPGLTTSFGATGGTAPYVFSVRPNGAGGAINSSTGIYTSPSQMNSNPSQISDVIQVRDSVGAIATASILVGNALILFCDIIQNQMNLAPGRVYLWDQKIFQPQDNDLYVAISVMHCKPFGNNIKYNGSGSGLNAEQSVNMQATLDVNIISRGPAARDQKEFVLMALNSNYSEQQQEANSFHIGRLPVGFINLSDVDGAAIPYRYVISFNIQYCITNSKSISYFDTFMKPSITVNS